MPSWNAFLALSTRLLMIDPTADLPLSPPSSGFAGDGVAVSVGAAGFPFPPSPEANEAALLFSADRPNAPRVMTELLVQRLASVGRAPVPGKYRSQGFVHFAEGALEAEVACAPGWVACAVRFVDATAGRATAVFPLGIVRVG